jgi:hypothetical protein
VVPDEPELPLVPEPVPLVCDQSEKLNEKTPHNINITYFLVPMIRMFSS